MKFRLNFSNMRLSYKILIVNFMTLLAVLSLTFCVMYIVFPWMYTKTKIEEIETQALKIVKQIEKEDDITKSTKETIGKYAIAYSLDIIIRTKYDNNVVVDIEESNSQYLRLKESGYFTEDRYYQENKKFKKYAYELYIGEEPYRMEVEVYLNRIDNLEKIMLLAVPYLLITCLIVSVLMSYVASKNISKPIRRITEKVNSMKNFQHRLSIEKKLEEPVNEILKLDRNIELLYKRLIDTMNSLEREMEEKTRSEKLKYDFLRMASHELKTPLTAINGMIEGMLYEVEPYTDKKTYLIECQKIIYNMTDLIKDILNSTRNLENEGKKDVILEELVFLMVSQHKSISKSKNLEVIVRIPASTVVKIQKDMFIKAFDNVVSNAFKYAADDGRVEIIYEAGKLSIYNSCTIIAEEDFKRVFEAFFRVGKGKESGNGLGLYLTKRMFDMMEIEFTFIPSKDKTGMEFIIYL